MVIPCFNDGTVLLEAIGSLDGASEPLEIVVVDDGSTDPGTLGTLDAVAARGLRVIHQENTGLPGARMRGVAETTAPYVFPLDADDLAEPAALADMADRLDTEPDAAACYGDYTLFGDEGELLRAAPEWLDPYRVAYTNEYPVTALFRRAALVEVGGWRPIRWGYEDWDLWMAFAEAGRPAVHLGPGRSTYRRRIHGERMLTGAKRHHRELYRTLRSRHPGLFGRIAEHRRASDMPWRRKLLYPVVYGGRPRFAWEPRVRALLDRVGVWTLRR